VDGEIRISEEDRGIGSGDPGTWGYGSPPPEPPQGAEWSRWATPGGEREIVLRPALPDRVVVLEPEWAFRLLSGSEARVFVRVPLWIRIDLRVGPGAEPADTQPAYTQPADEQPTGEPPRGGQSPGPGPISGTGRTLKLQETPALVMSDTWWGEYYQGELAYWLPTTARRVMAPRLFSPHMAVCPLLMQNQSADELRVEKLALRVAHLSLFVHEEHLWSDESRVLYQGDEEGSQVDMAGRPPAEAETGLLVSGPRTPIQRGLRARTFDRLRAFPGFGGAT